MTQSDKTEAQRVAEEIAALHGEPGKTRRLENAIHAALIAYGNAEFNRGVKESFDWVLAATANNYHGNPGKQRICDIENGFAASVAQDFLEHLSPDDHTKWVEIGELYDQIRALKEKTSP
jgi:hypothetical protein